MGISNIHTLMWRLVETITLVGSSEKHVVVTTHSCRLASSKFTKTVTKEHLINCALIEGTLGLIKVCITLEIFLADTRFDKCDSALDIVNLCLGHPHLSDDTCVRLLSLVGPRSFLLGQVFEIILAFVI